MLLAQLSDARVGHGPTTEQLHAMVAMTISIVALILAGVVVRFIVQAARHDRELLSRERMAALERGLDVCFLVPPPQKRKSPLHTALVTLFSGVGVMVLLFTTPTRNTPWGLGLLIALIGVALLLHWFAGGRREWEKQRLLDEELSRAYVERLRHGPGAAKLPEPGTSVER